MDQIDWRSAAAGAALLPLSWLAAELWKARTNVVKPNTSRVSYKVTTCYKLLGKVAAASAIAQAVVSGCHHRRLKGAGSRSGRQVS